MNFITKTGTIFYSAATAGIAVQQMLYGDFCLIFFPAWPHPIPGYSILAYVFSLILIAACVYFVTASNARVPALLLGGLLLLMLFLGQVPWEYLVFPHKKTHLGVWELPLKELAWAGGAFCIAGAYSQTENTGKHNLIHFLEKLIPFGPAFFSTTMILFGVCHFLYTPGIADMVPSWIPGHYFWAYFSAVALISAGISIIIRVWIKESALLLGIMILLWFLFLHLPNAIQYPLVDRGNIVFSALSALAFSGIAFVMSGEANKNKHSSADEKNFQY